MSGRKPRPIDGIDQYNFTKLANTQGTSKERRRFLAFAHIQDGKNFTDTAAVVKVERRTLMNWIRNFRKHGISGLMDKPGRGNKPLIPPEEYETIQKLVKELQEEREGGRVRGRDIADAIAEKYEKHLPKSTLYDTLKNANLVWITARSKHPKSDLQAQDTFKKTSKKTF